MKISEINKSRTAKISRFKVLIICGTLALLIISSLLVVGNVTFASGSVGFSENGILKEEKEWKRYDMHWYFWGWFGSSPAIADLGPDVNKKGNEPNSDLEIIAGSDEYCNYYPELGKDACGIWRIFDSTGNVEWGKDTQTDESRSSPAVVDLDGNGDYEIIGGTTSGWYVEVMNHLGDKFIWTFPYQSVDYVGGPSVWPSSPAVADINPNLSGLEIIIGNRYHGNLWAFDGDNSDSIDDGITISSADFSDFPYSLGNEGKDWDVLWIFNPPEGIGEDGIVSTPAIADVDNDKELEVVVGSTNGRVYVLNALDGKLEKTLKTNGPIYSSPAIANIDKGKETAKEKDLLEIIIGSTDGNVYCFQWDDKEGKTKWVFPTRGAVYSSPAIEDIDEDGEFEIVIGSNDKEVYSIDASGKEEWSYLTEGAVYSSPAIANRGKDFGFDIYVGSDDGYLYLLDGKTGSKIDRFQVYQSWFGGIHTSPSVADIDGDNKLEIAFYDWGEGSIYQGHTFWVLEDTQSWSDKHSIQWGMFRGNLSRTGSFRIRPFNAVELAKEVIGAPYLGDGVSWGGKGEDCSKWSLSRFASSTEIKEGYYYYDRRIDKCSSEKGKGVDCSGFSFWSYNRGYYGEIIFDRKVHFAGKTYPLFYDGATQQYKSNSVDIEKQDLMPGDLLFYNPSGDKKEKMTHVMMYTGPFTYEEKQYNVIHAEGVSIKKVIPAIYNPETEEVVTPGAKTLKVTAYGRVSDYKLDLLFVAHSPVDLIITDPEGEVMNREMGESLSMAYMNYDVDGDGKVDDIVAIPERKIGNYQIQVVLELEALPTDTYSLEVTAGGQTIVLAEDAPISEIPDQPYLIHSTEAKINAAPIADAEIKVEVQPKPLIEEPDDDYIIEGNTFYGANITLDSTASYDPEGVPLTYSWSENGKIIGETAILETFLSLGKHQITLTVSDGELTSTDALNVTIQDTIPPEVKITSPEEKTYLNTQKFIPLEYTIKDICDPNPQVKIFLDEELFTKESIPIGGYFGETEHILKIRATNASQNVGEDSVTFRVIPEPMKSFQIKEMKIRWAIEHPGKHFGDKTRFIIHGNFELPDKYERKDLDKSAFLYIKIADKLGKDKVIFKEFLNTWVYTEFPKGDDSLGQGIDIRVAVIHWMKRECQVDWCKKNWFFIQGELTLEGVDVNTLPREATVTLEIPVAPYGKAGSLAGKETIEFKKFYHIWFYHLLIKLEGWEGNWWKKFEFKEDSVNGLGNISSVGFLVFFAGIGLSTSKKKRILQSNTKGKTTLTILLVSVLVISIILVGVLGYKWWQKEKEFGKQMKEREDLLRQLRKLEGDIEKKSFFMECEKIKASKEDLIDIYLLGALTLREGGGGKHFWDLFVINPKGDIIGSGYPEEIGDMWQFHPIDKDGDSTMDIMIGTGFNRKIGDYLIIVIPQQDVALSDTYSLRLNNLILAKNVPFSNNLLDHLYILRQTETEIIPIVPASVGCQ